MDRGVRTQPVGCGHRPQCSHFVARGGARRSIASPVNSLGREYSCRVRPRPGASRPTKHPDQSGANLAAAHNLTVSRLHFELPRDVRTRRPPRCHQIELWLREDRPLRPFGTRDLQPPSPTSLARSGGTSGITTRRRNRSVGKLPNPPMHTYIGSTAVSHRPLVRSGRRMFVEMMIPVRPAAEWLIRAVPAPAQREVLV